MRGALAGVAAWLIAQVLGCPAGEPEGPCGPGEVLDGLTEACVPQACGAGPWPEGADDAVYVSDDGSDGARGTADDPLGRIRDGLALAAEDGLTEVVLGAGVWRENLQLDPSHDGITLRGRCADLSVIESREDLPTLQIQSYGVTLEDLTVRGGARGIFVPRQFGPPVRVRLRDVHIEGATRLGLAMIGDDVEVDAVRLRVTDTEIDGGEFGRGVNIEVGAVFRGEDIELTGNAGAALLAAGPGARAELTGGVLRGTRRNDLQPGGGIAAVAGGTVEASGTEITGNRGEGVLVEGSGSSAVLRDVWIHDQDCAQDRLCGGIAVVSGGQLEADDVVIEDVEYVGLNVAGAATQADVQGLTVRRTSRHPGLEATAGVIVETGATLESDGLLLEDNQGASMYVLSGADVTLRDSVMRRSLPVPDADVDEQYGLAVLGGAVVSDGLLLEEHALSPVLVTEEGTRATLTDTVMRGNTEIGMSTQRSAELFIDGLDLSEQTGSALRASTDSLIDVRNASIREVGVAELGVSEGAGLMARSGGRIVATDVEIIGCASVGAGVFEAGSSLVLQDVLIRDIGAGEGVAGKSGLEASLGATLTATDVTIEQTRHWGLQVSGEGTVAELTSVTVRGNTERENRGGGPAILAAGATVSAVDFVAEDNEGSILATDSGTAVDFVGLRLRRALPHGNQLGGVGLVAQRSGAVTGSDVLIEDAAGPGVYVAGGTMELADARLMGNAFAGAVVRYGSLSVVDGEIAGSRPHPSEGGGLGVFADNLAGAPPDLDLRGVQFSGFSGPAVYSGGVGRITMADCTVRGTGTAPWIPGGVVALGGMPTWDETEGVGLLLSGNLFEDLGGDAVLLDDSAATFVTDDQTGLPNRYQGVVGAPIVAQRCPTPDAVTLLDGSGVDPTCVEQPLPLGPRLTFDLYLGEGGAVP